MSRTSARPSRRSFLAALGATCLPGPAGAMMRIPSGGTLNVSLPLPLDGTDPHDPFDLSSSLLGTSLYEPLFATIPSGQTYPTLAAKGPKSEPQGCVVELRPGLRDSAGAVLGASAVAEALARAQARDPRLLGLGRIRPQTAAAIHLSTKLPAAEVARLLSLSAAAIVPRSPAVSTGSLAPRGPSWGELGRNPWAARGGSYLDTVRFSTRDLRGCLRDFETGLSDLGFLGSGLHRRSDTHRQLMLGSLGYVVVVPGRGAMSYAAPGVIADELARAAPEGLRALGIKPLESRAAGTWRGPEVRLLVDVRQPWLAAIADELARVWSGTGSRVRPEKLTGQQLSAAQRSRDFDLLVLFLRRVDDDLDRTRLYELDGTSAPKRDTKRDLTWTARRLHLGILGSLEPWVAVPRNVHTVSHQGSFDLGKTFFAPPAH